MRINIPKTAFCAIALLAAASLSAYATNYVAVQDGYWNSDIWNSAGGTTPTPGARPVAGDYFMLSLSGRTVTVGAGTYTIGLATSGVSVGSSIAAGATFNLDSGATLNSSSSIVIGGTLNVNNGSTISVVQSNNSAYLTLSTNAILNINSGGYAVSNRTTYVRLTGGQININGGTLKINNAFYGVRIASATGVGTYSMTSGLFETTGNSNCVSGQTTSDLGTGYFNQSGGTAKYTSTVATLQLVFASLTGRGIYNLSGGELIITPTANASSVSTLSRGLEVGGNTSTVAGADSQFNWTGGRLSISYVNMSLDNNGGDLNPTAYNNTSVSQTTLYTYMRAGTTTSNTYAVAGLDYTQRTAGRLTVDVKGTGAGEYDTVIWRTIEDKSQWDSLNTGKAYEAASATFEDGTSVYLNLLDGYVLQDGDQFDIFYSDSITLQGDLDVYVDNVLNDQFTASLEQVIDATKGDYNFIRLTYAIPEPATAAALLGMLALATVARRKR